MFWLSGEGLFEDVAPDDLRRFLETDPGRLEERLEQLVDGPRVETNSCISYTEAHPIGLNQCGADYYLPLTVDDSAHRF